MPGLVDCLYTLKNALGPNGTTPFERVFMAQGFQAKEGILAMAELLDGEPDFTMEDVTANVEAAVQEYDRLRQVLTSKGRWEEVPMDLHANHLRWIEEDKQSVELPGLSGVRASEEGEVLRRALEDLPALRDTTRRTPLWQVLVTRRRIIIHVHHAIMDGVGLAMVGGSIMLGMHKLESAALLLKENGNKSAASPQVAHSDKGGRRFYHRWLELLRQLIAAVRSFLWHAVTPLCGSLAKRPVTPISDASGETPTNSLRYVHIGPYPLESLKSRARAAGVTLNSLLLAAVTSALREYSAAHGGPEQLPLTVVVPVSFKLAGAWQQILRVNNDFSTMMVGIPPAPAASLQLPDPKMWSVSVALGAWAAQALLSLLPPPLVRWMLARASRLVDFIFSNVNAGRFGDTYVSRTTGARRKVACNAYGALTGSVRTFVLANSHGGQLHLGLTVDQAVVRDRLALAAALHRAVTGNKA